MQSYLRHIKCGLLLCLVALSSFGQRDIYDLKEVALERTWVGHDGKQIDLNQLSTILSQHELWLSSRGTNGDRADFHGLDFSGAWFVGKNLSDVDFRGATLKGASFTNAYFSPAKIEDIIAPNADFSGANLSNAVFGGADLSRALFKSANLRGATFTQRFPYLIGSKECNLGGADLTDATLDNAEFGECRVAGVIFEPKSLPSVRGIASANGLAQLTYNDNPDALFQLRKMFRDNGFKNQDRMVTYALNRRQAESEPLIERVFKRVAFEGTCDYGMSPGRPLRIWLILLLFFWVAYAIFMHLPIVSGVYLCERGRKGTIFENQIAYFRGRYDFAHFARQETRLLVWAGYFSLLSACNMGFKEFDFGRWIKMLPTSDFELKPKGWVRTVSGIQSLLSLYLLALWILTYFGTPFD